MCTLAFDISTITKEMIKMAENNIKIVEGDYQNEEDGLLYCGKCHTPKQARIIINGKEEMPYSICKCAAEKREKEYQEQMLRKRIDKYRDAAFDEKEMLNHTFANDDGKNPKLISGLKRYVELFQKFCKEGKGLLLYGDVGTGKTFSANCIANELINSGYSCRVTNFSRIINELWDVDKKQEYLDSLNRFRLLIIDDFGVERNNSPHAKEIVWSVIDSRYRVGLPLILTTNLSIEEIKTPNNNADKRIYSRILEMCHPILVEGKDKRKLKVRDDYQETKELLGI